MTEDAKTRVLFVCIGNSCRSQMAEAFARAYGADCIVPASAGIAPAFGVARDTRRAMAEKNIDMAGHFPKNLRYLGRAEFDLVINMSGSPLPPIGNARVVEWEVPDPIGREYEEHRDVRDTIERRVMTLIIELRSKPRTTKLRGQGSGYLPV